jgi:uncharacterized membrane protein (UPF0127 family)
MTIRWASVKQADGQETLVQRARWCDSFLCRLRGLTFRRRLDLQDSLILVEGTESVTGSSIHMFFVFFPIAAIWIDGAGRVVDSQLARPFRPLYVPQAPARYILEGPPSLLDVFHRGDKVRFDFLSS